MLLLSVQERLNLLERLEQRPLKVRPKEDYERIVRGLSAAELDSMIDLRPFMQRNPFVVQADANLSRTYRLFRTMGLRHLFVGPPQPKVPFACSCLFHGHAYVCVIRVMSARTTALSTLTIYVQTAMHAPVTAMCMLLIRQNSKLASKLNDRSKHAFINQLCTQCGQDSASEQKNNSVDPSCVRP